MRKFSVKLKLIILILLICGFVLLLSNDVNAANDPKKLNILHYQRNLYINQQNEKGLRDGVVKLPLVNKTGKSVEWFTYNGNVAIVNQYRICYRYKSREYNNCRKDEGWKIYRLLLGLCKI